MKFNIYFWNYRDVLTNMKIITQKQSHYILKSEWINIIHQLNTNWKLGRRSLIFVHNLCKSFWNIEFKLQTLIVNFNNSHSNRVNAHEYLTAISSSSKLLSPSNFQNQFMAFIDFESLKCTRRPINPSFPSAIKVFIAFINVNWLTGVLFVFHVFAIY